mgnify:CR=1 FL=1
MFGLSTTIDDLRDGQDELRRHRYGVIEVRDERQLRIHLRPLPKRISLLEVLAWGQRSHARRPGNRCWLYYNQPRAHANYLALAYLLSARDATFRCVRGALSVLDEIARIKGSDALLTDAWNLRVSDRLLRREGWEPHLARRWHRHYIKRFYGSYPARYGLAAEMLGPSDPPATEPAAPAPVETPVLVLPGIAPLDTFAGVK